VCVIMQNFSQIRQSAADLNNLRWLPSAILDIRGGRTWTTTHFARNNFLCAQQIWQRYLDRRRKYVRKIEFDKTPPGSRFYFRLQR